MQKHRKVLVGASFLALAISAQAYAQASEQSGSKTGGAPAIEEIVVTAQRRAQNLQDVPVSVTALSSGRLEKLGVQDFTQLGTVSPGVTFTSQNSFLATNIRGIGGTVGGPGVELQTAIYIDDVYYSFAPPALLELGTIAQVAVLKGPQGTLFGRNATAGVVQITTIDPSDKPSMRTRISVENYDRVQASAYVSSKLSDGVRADIGVVYAHQGEGWGRNRTNGQNTYDLDHSFAARSKWIFEPGTGTKITLVGDLVDNKDGFSPSALLPGTLSGGVVQPDLGYDAITNDPEYVATRSWGVSGRLEQDLGDLELTSISAFRKGKLELVFDADALPLSLTNLNVTNDYKQLTQEVRLQSSRTRLKWVLGGFYLNGVTDVNNVVDIAVAGLNRLVDNRQKAESWAAFGEATYPILENTNITGGVRYTSERKRESRAQARLFLAANGALLNTQTFPNRSSKASAITFRASIDHRFSEELMVYASVNKGFKSGGYNTVAPGSPSFANETVLAYEVGIKSDLFDRRVRLNLAGYYYDYSDIQVLRYELAQFAIVNGPSATIYGLEGDIEIAVTPELKLSGGANWGSPKFGTWVRNGVPTCPILAPSGGSPGVPGDCKGNIIPLASQFSASGQFDYTTRLADGSLTLSGVVSYNDGFYFSPDNNFKVDRHTLLNGNIAWTDPSDRFTLSVYGRNLTNKRVGRYINPDAASGVVTVRYAAPRTYGVSVAYKF